MTPQIQDPEVQVLAGLSSTLEIDHVSPVDDPWNGSPFQWILKQPSRTKGAISEALVAGWCAAKGFDVVRPTSSEADRIIHGYRMEIKLSTLWRSGQYRFQQLRDQEYDFAFCLGLSPFDAHAWLLPKAILMEHVIGHMGQHTGATGSDTAWLGFDAQLNKHDWMEAHGGRLADVSAILEALGHGPY